MAAIRMGPELMRVSIDVPLVEREKAIGLLALTDQPLKFSIEVDSSPASERIERPDDRITVDTEKGEHGLYWNLLFRKGFQNYPDLIEVLDCAGDQIRLRLHDIFEVDSLSKVSPAQFEDWLASEGLHSLITLSRQAQAKLQEAA